MGCLHSTSNFRLIEQKVGDKTTTISSIAAADVTEATGNVTITVTYVPITPGGGEGGGDDIIPGKPSKPDDHKPGVPDKTPDKPIIETKSVPLLRIKILNLVQPQLKATRKLTHLCMKI